MDTLALIGRDKELFQEDIVEHEVELRKIIGKSSFLVLGGAGTIGQATVKELFKRNPKKLHIVDISENNLVELVRDLRSSFGYIDGDFRTFALDIGSMEYDAFIQSDGQYDFILNLSALKHVRSEKDPFTLMRMIHVNILNTDKTLQQSIHNKAQKYFCVSTDKAANPVNMMGASKRIMEMFLMRRSQVINASMARFANVAFSDGSLLHGFNKRIEKQQPIVAPNDVKRYFVTPKEAGELCLMSCMFGDNRDIFFPQLSESLNLIAFSDIAIKFLYQLGFEPFLCENEEEARGKINELIKQRRWPCLFSTSDTTGEKDFEEFFTSQETLDLKRFHNIGIIKNDISFEADKLLKFENEISKMKSKGVWVKDELVNLFNQMIPNFNHKETGKYLDAKM